GAAEALGKIKDARAVEPLIAALKDEYQYVRKWTAYALGEIKDARAVEPLIAALKDEYQYVREGAAEALGKIKDARAVEPLIAALKDEHSDVNWSAAEALGKINDAHAVEPLIAALKDKDPVVRKGAADALGEIKDARAVEPLITALKNIDPDVRVCAANALVKIGAPAIEPLIAATKDIIHSYMARKDGDSLRRHWNIVKVVLLKDVESNDYGIIENTLYAFIGIGKEEIIPELIEKLNTKGGKTMAEAYLNCGHPELAEAAREWARRNGYSISTGSGNAPVGWGRW
ncbi:MAG TPA: HEAT repeat domain-containing protein, partial [Candidatus Wunengus sp. YC64]|uniref:HEAT repeat domain-containing protein n=1 Tax=Candidatus Wunengus sp. YC64 TaxID=3367700 RepID=UPI004027C679